MSGECEKCGEHTLECKCPEWGANADFRSLPKTDPIECTYNDEDDEFGGWISWKKKPTEEGYYWFALRECGDDYSCHTFQEYGFYDPKHPDYAMGKREYKEDENHFLEIRAWMKPPEWPYGMDKF